MNDTNYNPKSVFITGAGGFIGRKVVEGLAQDRRDIRTIVAADIRNVHSDNRLEGVEYVICDIRSDQLSELFKQYHPDTVVHLAAVVTPGRKADREFEYSVDVQGTENILKACKEVGVRRFIYTSSGAAYGYYADNAEWIDESDAIRGNPEFAYSDHKRLVEEMLARWRQNYPELGQLIFRPGTVLGADANNQITALFEKPRVLGLRGSDSPFVFIWDQDVAQAIIKGIHDGSTGIYNMAGDGALKLSEMAAIMNKPLVKLPVWLVKAALWILKLLGRTQYGPEQVNFIRYRPVLSNRRLKEEFGYKPEKTTREVFEYFLKARHSGS